MSSSHVILSNTGTNKKRIIFGCVNSAFLQLYCLKLSFKLANISRSYEQNNWAPSFPFMVYYYYYYLPLSGNILNFE